jgi:hypothetical protein
LIVRSQSIESERYLSVILYYLNNKQFDNIDGSLENGPCYTKYDCHSVNVYDDIKNVHFLKRTQQKNENTLDI